MSWLDDFLKNTGNFVNDTQKNVGKFFGGGQPQRQTRPSPAVQVAPPRQAPQQTLQQPRQATLSMSQQPRQPLRLSIQNNNTSDVLPKTNDAFAPKMNLDLMDPNKAAQLNKGLDAGKSWESIAAETGTAPAVVKSFSQKTRPNYGIKSPFAPRPGLAPATPRDESIGKAIKELRTGTVNFGKDIASGIQQSVGNVADVSLMGGAMLDDIGTSLNPFLSEEKKNQRRLEDYTRTEKMRDFIKSSKTITGESYNPHKEFTFTGDVGRDAMNLTGRSLQTGLDATQFLNPTRLAGKGLMRPAGMGFVNTAKFAGRDAAFLGTGQGLATGAETYGNTGDINEAAKTGAKAGIMSAIGQGGMDLGFYNLGKGTRKALQSTPAQKTKDAILASTPSKYLFGDMQPVKDASMRQDLTKALQKGTDNPVPFGELHPEVARQVNVHLANAGGAPISNPEVLVHPNVVNKLIDKRINSEGLSPATVARMAHDAVHAPTAILDATDKSMSARLAHQKSADLTHNAFVGQHDGRASVKSVYPIKDNVVSGTPTSRGSRSASSSLEAGSADMQLANAVSDAATGNTVAKKAVIVNDPIDTPDTRYINETVAAHKSPEGFVDDVVNRIWERNKTGQGVDTWLTPDDYGSGFSRRNAMSNNSPFYQNFYAEYGRKPSKAAIRDMVEQELGIKSSQDGIHNARLLVDNQEMAPVDRDVFRQLAEREDGLNNLINSADIHHELMQTDPKYAATAARAEAIRGAITEAEARGGANPSRLEALKQEHDMLQSGLVGARTSSSDALQAKSAKAQSRHIKTLQELPTAPTRNQSHRQHVAQQSDTQYRNHAHSTPDNTPGALSRTAPPAHQNQPQLPHRSEFPHTQLDPYGSSMTQKQADDYTKAMSKSQDIARNDGIASKIEKIKSSKSDFKEKFIDDMAPIEDRLNRAIKNGAIVDPQDHITYQIDRSRRSEGITHAYIQDNGLDKIIQGVPDTKKFDQYLIAKHAAALDPEIMTGRNGRKDYALVNALKDEYEPFAKKLYAYNQKLLDTSVEYELISKDTASMLKKKYPEYVPLNRIFNEGELAKISGSGGGEASISKQTVVQRIKGSERAIDSPLNSIIDKTRVVVEQGERNKAAKMLVSYKNLPNNPFNLHKLPDGEAIGTRSAVSFLENGKKVTYLTDKSIADAAKGMTRQQIGLWGQILSVPTRVLRMGATSANAGFAGANVVKDLVGAAINSKHSMRIAQPDVFGKALAAALKHDGKYYRELMREGIAGTSFDMYRNAPNLNIREIRSHKNLAARSLENMRHPLRTIENTIGRSEDFGRALQYYSNKAGFEKEFGKGSRKAAILAGDQARSNSTNFFRHGSYGKNINLAIPYWNPSVQGARIQTRRLIERPAQTLMKIGFAIAAPSAMIALNNYSDENRRKIMDNMPPSEKEGYIVVLGVNPTFNEETGRWEDVYKIPVPPQHIGIHDTIQRAVRSAKTGEPFDIIKSLGGITENYTTINPTDARKTTNNYLPQAAKLVAEPMTNMNFYSGEKIVPESMKNLNKEDQKSKNTSLTAQYLSKITGESPLMIDNIIHTATGGAGQNVIKLTDTGIAKATGRGNEEIKGRDVLQSITDRFIGARGISDGMLYYKSLDEAAKKNKLAGKDLAIFNSLADAKMGADGEIVGTTERDVLNKYQNLASRPNVAKAIADAALARAKKTGEPVDPLYKLSHEKQMKFYNIKAQNKDSQDQRDLKNRESGWYKDFSKQRRDYFSKLDIPESKNSLRVKYPEVSADVQKKIDTYFAMQNGDGKYAYMDANQEIGQHFKALSKYSNDVRVAQGVNPLRTYPEASKRVQGLMDTGNFKDPEVSKYLQDMNLYNITKDSALAQIQGNDMTPKSLKAINSMGRYGLVKNPDGSFALKYSDAQGSGRTSIQPGAVDGSGFGVRSRKGGGRKSRGGRSGRRAASKTSLKAIRPVNLSKADTALSRLIAQAGKTKFDTGKNVGFKKRTVKTSAKRKSKITT